ncbi:unnamed protein product, partial [Porites lobata]
MTSEAKAASTCSTPLNEQDVQFLSDGCDDLVKSGEGVIEGLPVYAGALLSIPSPSSLVSIIIFELNNAGVVGIIVESWLKTDHTAVILLAGTKLKPICCKVLIWDCRENRKAVLCTALAENWDNVLAAPYV